MQEPKPTRTGGDTRKAPPRQGNTLPVQGETQERAPRMPHERDESADSQQSSEPSARSVGKQAHKDLARGLVDTDKGPVLEETYDRLREDDDAKPLSDAGRRASRR